MVTAEGPVPVRLSSQQCNHPSDAVHGRDAGILNGTAFQATSRVLSGRSGDLLVAAIGANTGSQPTFATGWTSLPVLRLSPYRLTTAYQVADADTPCATAGTTTSEWGAALVTFR